MAQTVVLDRIDGALTSEPRRTMRLVIAIVGVVVAAIIAFSLVFVSTSSHATPARASDNIVALQAFHADADASFAPASEDAKLAALMRLKSGK